VAQTRNARGHGASVEAVAPGDPSHAFDVLTPSDPSRFYPRFRVIPAVIAVTDQSGDWDAVGQTRVLHLSDGSSVRETTTDVERPGLFAYELTEFTRLFGRLVHHARAEWRFQPADGGTRITWSYTFFGLPGRGWIVAVIVRMAWAAYMRRVIVGLVDEVRRRGLA